MKKILFFVLFCCFAGVWTLENNLSYLYTPRSGQIIRADSLKGDYDTLRNGIRRLSDSLDAKFVRTTGTFTKLNVDTIRSNPHMDSIDGPTYIDTMLLKKLYITDLKVGTAGAVIDKIYLNGAEDTLVFRVKGGNEYAAPLR